VRARRLALRWAPVLAAVVLVALVAAAGGFGRASGVGPRRFDVGEPVELRRWVVAVESVELVDTTSYDSPSPPTLRVALQVTWTGTATEDLLGTGLVSVVVPGGPAASPEVVEMRAGQYSGGYDPDVPRPAQLELVWPAGADENAPRAPAPTSVQVVLSDERPAQNFLFADQFVAGSPLGHVEVPLADRRTR
jgi:hypothetical protein